MAELLPCTCGSDDICICESRILFFSQFAIIKCPKCQRTIQRRTLKRATKAWNTRTTKERKNNNDL